jgi:hypothetical protein
LAKTFSVPDGCESIRMGDNKTVYKAHNNRVTVDRPEHVDEISTSRQVHYGYMSSAPFMFTHVDGKTCASCGFNAFTWQASCPRCQNKEFTQGLVS